MPFAFKSFHTILTDMIAKFLSQTGINDVNPGSNLSTFLEAAASEDANQYFQMLQIIRNYSLDTTEDDDLRLRAKEYGLEELSAQRATGVVKFRDASFQQKKTKIYSGSRGPTVGQSYIDVDNASLFTNTGAIIIGRETDNNETMTYSNIVNYTNYFRINLVGALTNDHGTEETVILSQGGDRIIPKGTLIRVPASDTIEELQFITSELATILDGDVDVDNVSIQSVVTGSKNNVPSGSIIDFDSKPFSTIEVVNEFPITNGRDRETNDELRDRIKKTIQGLSRGTISSIESNILNLSSSGDNKRVVSLNVVDSVDLNEVAYLYIDDGTGLEPSVDGVGNETVIGIATGGEKYLQLNNSPIIKAELSTEKSQPFSIINGDTFIVEVNGVEEQMIFGPEDYSINGSLTAYEVSRAINNKMSTIESRTIDGGTRLSIRAISLTNESIQVTGGSAAAKLEFPDDLIDTISLYKSTESEISLLSKDGKTAFVESANQQPFSLFGGNSLTIVVDGKTANTQTIAFQASDFINPGFALTSEVVTRINLELAGATASIIDGGSRIEIRSNTEQSENSKIHITGGSANANLGFSTVEDVGYASDFILNRLNGQIKLNTLAVANETYEAGSANTRAFILSNNDETYELTNGDTLSISVDGATPQVATFNTADFSLMSAATAQEIINVINRDLVGLTASVVANKIRLQTNSWDWATGSIEVTAATGTAPHIGFNIGTEIQNLKPHVAFITSTTGSFTFAEGDMLNVVVDKNPTDNQFNVVMDLDGTVTTGDASSPYTTFIANIASTGQNYNLKFTDNADLVGYDVKWLGGTAPNNAGEVKTVSAYNATTGQFTLSSGTTNTIDTNDTFTIIPKTAKNVVRFLSNTAVSSLSSLANISLSNNGTKVQLSTKTVGLNGAIQVTGGTANTQLSYSTSQFEGRNGYEYYTGLISKVQHTLNGLDSDTITFPGVKATGVQIEVLPPLIKLISFKINVLLDITTTIISLKDRAINEISTYVNALNIGQDVVLSEITDRLMSIDGILDVIFTTPAENVAIEDNEKARVNSNDIVFA